MLIISIFKRLYPLNFSKFYRYGVYIDVRDERFHEVSHIYTTVSFHRRVTIFPYEYKVAPINYHRSVYFRGTYRTNRKHRPEKKPSSYVHLRLICILKKIRRWCQPICAIVRVSLEEYITVLRRPKTKKKRKRKKYGEIFGTIDSYRSLYRPF